MQSTYTVQRQFQMKPVAINRFGEPKFCETCSSTADTEVLVEYDTMTRIRRFCATCLAKADYS